jgi:RHS repeat-associated protein
VLDGWNNMKPTPVGNEHFDVYAELDGTNQLIARYLHGDEFYQTFARVDLRAANASERVLWYLTDHLNSVRLVLDESGAVLNQIAYDAFGNIVAQLNPLLVNPILFASRDFDAETGLYYNRARYLDPTTGRWTTQDPLGFAAGDANLYRYVGNTPTMLVDPSGYIWSWAAAGFTVELGKKAEQKINVPVLFGLNGRLEKSFDADAYHQAGGFVVEVEAGRGVVNNQFLKDLFQACMMHDVFYLAIAVRNVYKGRQDFEVVCRFLSTLYASQRLQLPLRGILVVGY